MPATILVLKIFNIQLIHNIVYMPSNLDLCLFQFLSQSASLLLLGCHLTCKLIKSDVFSLNNATLHEI